MASSASTGPIATPSFPATPTSPAGRRTRFTAFYLTDYLARQFDRLIWQGLGLDRHPELLPLYFGNYTKIVYLAQTRDEEIAKRAMAAAKKLGLAYEYRYVGYGELLEDLRKRA